MFESMKLNIHGLSKKTDSVEKCLCRREEHVSYSRLRPRVRFRMFVSTPTTVWFGSS